MLGLVGAGKHFQTFACGAVPQGADVPRTVEHIHGVVIVGMGPEHDVKLGIFVVDGFGVDIQVHFGVVLAVVGSREHYVEIIACAAYALICNSVGGIIIGLVGRKFHRSGTTAENVACAQQGDSIADAMLVALCAVGDDEARFELEFLSVERRRAHEGDKFAVVLLAVGENRALGGD